MQSLESFFHQLYTEGNGFRLKKLFGLHFLNLNTYFSFFPSVAVNFLSKIMFEKKLDFFLLKWDMVESGAKEIGGDILHSLRATSASRGSTLQIQNVRFLVDYTWSTTNCIFKQIITIAINYFTDNNSYYLLDRLNPLSCRYFILKTLERIWKTRRKNFTWILNFEHLPTFRGWTRIVIQCLNLAFSSA